MSSQPTKKKYKRLIERFVVVLLVISTHIIQVTQNVTSIANFNLVLDIEIESSEHRIQTGLEASYTQTAEAGVWRDGGEEGQGP